MINISVEGCPCLYCINDESIRNDVTENLNPPVQETRNVRPEYCVPAADVNIERIVRGTMLYEPNREESIETNDKALIPHEKYFARRVEENYSIGNFSQGKTSSDFDQYPKADQNCLSDFLNLNQINFHGEGLDISSSEITETFQKIKNHTPTTSQQWEHAQDLSSINEWEKKANYSGRMREQEILNPTGHVEEIGKLDFAGSILFQSKNSTMNFSPYSSKNVKVQKEDNVHPFSSALDQKNSTMKDFQGNIGATKNTAEKKAKTTFRRVYKICDKCQKIFKNESNFYAHIQSNCDPKPFKCDKCSAEFSGEYPFKKHQRTHTRMKCNQCDFVTFIKKEYITHIMLHTE